MTELFFDGEQGTAVTVANTPGLSLVNSPSAATLDTAVGLHGTTGLKLVAQPAGPGIVRFVTDPNAVQSFSGVVTMPDTSTQPMTIFTLRHASGVVLRVLKTTDGRVTVNDSANTITNVTTPGTFPAAGGDKFRVELRAAGGSATAGRIRLAIYTPTGSTALGSVDVINANLTVNDITGGDLGDTQNAAAFARMVGWEDVRVEAGRTTEWGPYAPPVVVTPQSTAAPVSEVSNTGGWTGSFGDLADTSAATFVESPAAPVTNAAVRYRLGPLVTASTFSLTIPNQLTTAATSNTARVRLYQGATLRKEWTFTPTTTAKDQVLAMTAAECAAVTDWAALDVELSWTGA